MRQGDRVAERFLLQEGPLHRSTDEASEVWLAHDERMGRDVVLKRSAAEPVAESRAMAKFNHQHVITLYEYLTVRGEGADAGNWLVMEYAPQGSLAGRPTIGPLVAARIGAQIASALVDLHAKGIVHCDIKPANIVIAENGAAKLTDFGAAYRVDDEETITPETPISYTPAYAAPEVVRGNPARTSDVYSLAATVFALVAGHSPHVPDKHNPELGPLADVLFAMRRLRPEDRPDAARAQRMFEDIAAGVEPLRHSTVEGTVVPAQLPGDVYGFAGRDDELEQLDRLVARAADEQPTAVVISAISGTAGVGKTALAVHWAHLAADRFPDGQLYANLRGFDPSGQPLDPGNALRGFLGAMGVAPERMPSDLDAQTALFRSLLVGKRVLVVVDDARDTNQVRPLLPGTPGCPVVVTSRGDLTGLVTRAGAHPLVLDLFTPAEARQLLERRLGHDRLAAEPDAVDELIAACARLPLALAIVAARAAIRPGHPLAALVTELRDSLGAFTADTADVDLRAVFSWSYEQLTPEAARLFRLFGLHPGPDISAPAAASLAGIPRPEANRLLAELTRAHVVDEPVPGRYAPHDLLRTYARELAHTRDNDDERQAARERLLDHYLHTAHAGEMLLQPDTKPIELNPPATGVLPESIADQRQAMAWFTAEHDVLLAIIDYAADADVWKLAWALSQYLDRVGRWQVRVDVWRAALDAAIRLNDPAGEARAHRGMAAGYAELRRFDEARTSLEHALRVHGELGDRKGQAHDHRALVLLHERQGQHDAALRHAQQALKIYQEIGYRSGQASCLSDIGWEHAKLGEYHECVSVTKQALELLRELDNGIAEAAAWDNLGFAHHHLGDSQEAIACYRKSLDMFENLNHRDSQAYVLDHLGDAYHAIGELASARDSWRRALVIFEDLDLSGVEGLRTKLASPTTSFRSIVYREPGRFAGWPANYGMWAWGDEVLVGFVVGWTGRLAGVHARDKSRPFVPMLARSLDGGRTWHTEPFTGRVPGAESLSADEHVDAPLRAAPRLRETDFAAPEQPVDFSDPETVVLCARTGLAAGARSWFYVSTDRGRSWRGPHPLPSFDLPGVAARTDVVPLDDPGSALFLLTGAKRDGNEGRVFAVRTTDGGRGFDWRGWVGAEPSGWTIMPSSVRTSNGAVLTALRCNDDGHHRIEVYSSHDEGATWTRLGTPVPDTGYGGNPPAMTFLPDGRVLLVFGVRAEPFGLCYVTSADEGRSWSTPVRLTDDTGMHDMGYPRVVAFQDGTALACFYSNERPEGERFIEAVRWTP